MLFTRATYVGIDPTSGPQRISYAAIDGELKVMALGRGGLDEVLAFLGGQKEAAVAINGPSRPNQKLLADRELRARFSPAIDIPSWSDYRLAEYQLAHHGLRIYHTPSKESDCPAWMRLGFTLYRRLTDLDFKFYPAKKADRQLLEVSSYVCYCAWLGRKPFRKRSLEGRLQRQLVLYDFGLDLPDPMRFFEEITRHRLLHGELPEDIPYRAGELAALAAAYTSWLALNRPAEVCAVGDVEEGQILVPVKELKGIY